MLEKITYMLICLALALTRAGLGHNAHAIGLICSLARFNTSYGAKLSLNTVKPLSGQSSALSGSLKAQMIMSIIIIHSFVTLCKCLLTSAYQKCYSRAHTRALFDSRFPLFVLRFPPYLIHDSLYLKANASGNKKPSDRRVFYFLFKADNVRAVGVCTTY